MSESKSTDRATFASKLGMIAAAAGSAVGLGNIWRFPSVTASDGGAIFLLVYLACIFIFGIPLMIAEFLIGRAAGANASGAFSKLVPKKEGWQFVGGLGVLASFLILGFYFVVGGWTLEYIIDSVSGSLMSVPLNDNTYHDYFTSFLSNPLRQALMASIFIVLTAFFVISGVKKGIETSAKFMMPLLFVLLIGLAVRSITLEGAGAGIEFLFKPDLETLKPTLFLDAIGQAFFSLSLGMGIMITYGSYFKKKSNLTLTATKVAFLDTLVAILAGITIFPSAFALTSLPANEIKEVLEKGGAGLVFMTIPELFRALPLSTLWSTCFFVFLGIAALTSMISLMEVVTVFVHEEFKLSRTTATILLTIILIGLSFGCSYSSVFFDRLDFITAKIFLPLGGLFVSIFVGWRLKKAIVYDQLTNGGTIKLSHTFLNIYRFILQYIAPIVITIIFIYGLL
ncbi:MAG: sodium-dependent transporter [Bacteroides sp.]